MLTSCPRSYSGCSILVLALAWGTISGARESNDLSWPTDQPCADSLVAEADPPAYVNLKEIWPKLKMPDHNPDVYLEDQTPLWKLAGLPTAPTEIAAAERTIESTLRTLPAAKRVGFALKLLAQALPRPTQSRLAIAWEMIAKLIHRISRDEITLFQPDPWRATRLFASDGSIVYRGPLGPAFAISREGLLSRGHLGHENLLPDRLVPKHAIDDWDPAIFATP